MQIKKSERGGIGEREGFDPSRANELGRKRDCSQSTDKATTERVAESFNTLKYFANSQRCPNWLETRL